MVRSSSKWGYSQKCKNGVKSFENVLQNHLANFYRDWHKPFLEEEDSYLFKGRDLRLSKERY
jgi:hypothetical protein